MQHEGKDEGQAAAFVLVLLAAVLACLGLVADGGRLLIDRAELTTLTHEAARAGAQQLSEQAVTAGSLELDEEEARRAAAAHLAAGGADAEVRVEGDQVTVTARRTARPRLLPIGPQNVQARATASALPRGGGADDTTD